MFIDAFFGFFQPGAGHRPVRKVRRHVSGHRRGRCRLWAEPLEARIVPATLSIGDAVIVECNEEIQYALVSVNLDGPSNKTVSVNYATANGTAKAGSDYGARSGTLNFFRGETRKTIAVPVYGDRQAEPNESFTLTLSGARRARIADGQGVVTIVDDEPRILISGASESEGNSGFTLFTFIVSLSSAYDQSVTVNYATADGSGFLPGPYGWATVADNDYRAKSGTLTFAPGETTKTIVVEVLGDTTPETEEYFFVNLGGASGNALIASAQAGGWIYDDDTDWGGGGGDGGDCTPDHPYYPAC